EKNIPVDSFITITQQIQKLPILHNRKETKVLLSKVTNLYRLNHTHTENDFVDFDKEKLLYNMLSNEGPKIAVGDINNDGKDDFFIGGSKDFSGSLYLQTEAGF